LVIFLSTEMAMFYWWVWKNKGRCQCYIYSCIITKAQKLLSLFLRNVNKNKFKSQYVHWREEILLIIAIIIVLHIPLFIHFWSGGGISFRWLEAFMLNFCLLYSWQKAQLGRKSVVHVEYRQAVDETSKQNASLRVTLKRKSTMNVLYSVIQKWKKPRQFIFP
jgi:hypothetical protein